MQKNCEVESMFTDTLRQLRFRFYAWSRHRQIFSAWDFFSPF